jgi:hypothetical protein
LPVNDSEASYCAEKTHVFFGNGMFNEQSSAESGLRKLKRKLIETDDLLDEKWTFELSYNHNEGVYSLFEVYRQSMGDQASSYWRWLGSLEVAPDWFKDAMQEMATNFDLVEALVDDDLRRHVQRYQGLLMEGNRVLVVAHSQGNLYANSAYATLANDSRVPMEAFGIVSVATPASYVAGNGPYFTLMYDLVISAVQMALPSTLPGNVVNTISDLDWKHHSFIDSYLNGDQTGPMIINSALSTAKTLVWPEPQVGSGPISVTLTWGEQPDVDLHIFEPNYSHVYYANPMGLSGYLDYDDSNSFGPEHYFVTSCDQLETGTYEVAVNYYRGNGPETGHVQIQAGDIVRDYTVPLFMAFGSSGNFNARQVASVEVLGDANAGYEFKVEGR